MVESTSSAKPTFSDRQIGPKNEDLNAYILNAVVDVGIYKLSPTGIIETWSRGAERLMGYSAKEIIGINFSTFYTQPDLDDDFPQFELAEAARTGRFEGAGWRTRKGSLTHSSLIDVV